MKVQARVEKELFRAKDKVSNTKETQRFLLVSIAERIDVLEWVLSDLDNDLDEFIRSKQNVQPKVNF